MIMRYNDLRLYPPHETNLSRCHIHRCKGRNINAHGHCTAHVIEIINKYAPSKILHANS